MTRRRPPAAQPGLAPLVLALLALAVVPFTPAAARADSDPRAVAIADQVMAALGGHDRWERLRGLRWSFEVSVADTVRSSRRHGWDRVTGRHRAEGRTRAGQAFVFVEDMNAASGAAMMGGQRIEGDSLAKLIKRAKSLWTNDSYWMLMPYKLRDPGVTLGYAGETAENGVTYDKIALSFDHVGETPGDHYWVYVNRANHRIEKWDFVLEGQQPPAQTWTWEGWEQHDAMWFPTAHRQGTTVIYTRGIETVTEFPASEFELP